mmetsp:Transcript_19169/g.37175  ORF Transcript_19169/g.37175 Transcript_19169/m.37175 type:complete len:347 (+) Transcript_19169:70-1110(+)
MGNLCRRIDDDGQPTSFTEFSRRFGASWLSLEAKAAIVEASGRQGSPKGLEQLSSAVVTEVGAAEWGCKLHEVLGGEKPCKVWKARGIHDDKQYAIKVFDLALSQRRSYVDPNGALLAQTHRVVEEARILKKASTLDRVAPLIKILHTPAFLMLVTPYLPLGSLFNHPFEDSDIIADVMLSAFQAVKSLHAIHVCHCDIKPANLLLRSESECILTDFGSAQDLEKKTLEAPLGTPGFMSPELLRMHVDDNSGFPTASQLRNGDVWALGVTLCTLVGDRKESPFQGETMGEILASTKNSQEIIDTLPLAKERTGSLLKQLLAPAVADRTTNLDSILQHAYWRGGKAS